MTTANELGRRIMAPVRRDLPSGTVTSLFTDVEGSTKPVHALGADSYAPALAEHRRILRQAFSGHSGVEVDTQGDAFFFAFPTAESAAELLATVEEVDRIARPGAPDRRRPKGPPADEYQ